MLHSSEWLPSFHSTNPASDHLTSYFNLAKSVTVLQDTSGNPIVVQVLPEAPKLKVQDAAVVAMLPKVPLPSSAVGEPIFSPLDNFPKTTLPFFSESLVFLRKSWT